MRSLYGEYTIKSQSVLMGTVSAVAVALAFAVTPMAASAAAVSGNNGKLDLSVGSFDDDTGAVATGAFSMPLSSNYGVQFDGLVGTEDGNHATAGGAVHLFWRDPSEGLIGLYGSYTYHDSEGDSVNVSRVAVEGERYWGRITLSALAGAEFGDVSEDGFFSLVDLSYYASDDLRVYLGHQYAQAGSMAKAGIEWQVKSGMSLFAEGRSGANDYDSALAGIRFYFGEDKTLIRRHREDDPAVRLQDDLFSISQNCAAPDLMIGRNANVCNADDEEEYYYYYQ